MSTRAFLIAAVALLGCDDRKAASAPPRPVPAGSGSAVAAPAPTGFDEALLATVPSGVLGGQIIDASMHPARDVIVYVKTGPGSGKAKPPGTITMDQKDKTFLPHVLPIVVGTRVEFKNSDPVLHNVYSRVAAKTFDLGMFGKTEAKSVTFDKPGRVDVFCAIHTNMHAIILVLATGDFATTDARGFFTIKDLAPGTYTVAIWDEVAVEREVSVELAANQPGLVKHELANE